MYIYIYIYIHILMCSLCIYIYMSIHTHIYIYIYTHICGIRPIADCGRGVRGRSRSALLGRGVCGRGACGHPGSMIIVTSMMINWLSLSLLPLLLSLLLVVVVVVVPNGLLGGLWTKCMFFKQTMFSPRPEATCQVNFNAKTHLLSLKCNTNKKRLSLRRDAPFRVYCYIIQTTKQQRTLALGRCTF